VDDNDGARYAVAQLLRKAGFRVVEAATGSDALQQVASHPDLIVLDIGLPDASGFEVCRQFRSRPETARVPILHLSGTFSTSEYRVRGLEGGADGFLTKPVEPAELIATLRAMLRMRRAEEALRESNRTLEAIIQACPLAIVNLDTEGKVRRWNAAAERIFGWTETEVLGRLPPYVPEDRRAEFHHNLQQELQGQSFLGIELHRLRKDGTPIVVSLWSAPIRDEQGVVHGVMGVLADMTERKREAEERNRLLGELQTERAQLEAVLQQMPGGVLIAEALSGRLLFGNDLPVRSTASCGAW
jgi:PAS domain S-box-containing protein